MLFPALTLLHNPRCSKSREALAKLDACGRPYTVRDYQQNPLDLPMLRGLHALIGGDVRDLLRTGDPVFREHGLDDPGLGPDALLAAVAAHPALLQRPIVIDGARAVVARPVEVLDGWL